MSKCQKYAKLTGLVLFDLACFATVFVAASILIGKLLIAKKVETNLKPRALGALVLMGLYGLVAVIIGFVVIIRNHRTESQSQSSSSSGPPVPVYTSDSGASGAAVGFVIAVAIVVIIASVWLAYVTIKSRVERHQRAVGVNEFAVVDRQNHWQLL
jgi:cytochrome bd-type quinol oxidase subunit 2